MVQLNTCRPGSYLHYEEPTKNGSFMTALLFLQTAIKMKIGKKVDVLNSGWIVLEFSD